MVEEKRPEPVVPNAETTVTVVLLPFKSGTAEGLRVLKENAERLDMPAGFSSLAEEWGGGQVSARQAASRLGISHHTFLKYARIHVGG